MVKIFIGNLATVATDRDLKPLFDLYGTVTECVVMENQGFGFVHMTNQKEAKRAIRDLNGCQVVGKRINVELSTEQRRGTKPTSAKSVDGIDNRGAKASTENRTTKPSTDLAVISSSTLQDCYYYQISNCTRESQCPFLHRTFPQTVCKLFMFGKCRRHNRCPKQHLSTSSLPPPSDREVARVMEVSRGHACMIKKKEAKSLSASTGAIKKTVGVGRKKGLSVPEMSAFECLDCGVTTTSCFLLETHLNTEDHWDRLKQMKVEGEKIKGVVGDRQDILCDVCGVRVKQGKMEKHKEEDLHIAMLGSSENQDDDWVTVGDKRTLSMSKEVEDNSQDIHVSNIPQNMTMNTFRLICLQFGEVIKLKMLPMYGDKRKHAYVRYSTEESKELAALKLKNVQKFHFAHPSEQFIEKGESEEASVESEGCNVTNVFVLRKGRLVSGFACDLCDAVCNSSKQHRQHMMNHMRKKINEEDSSLNREDMVGGDSFANTKHNLELEDNDSFLLSPGSTQMQKMAENPQQLNLSQLSNQLEQLTIARQEQESQLILCQNQMKICKQAGADLGQTLKLLEEELDLQRKLRDLEFAEQKMKTQLDSSLPTNSRTETLSGSSSGSISSLTHGSKLQTQQTLGSHCDFENRTAGEYSSSKTYFHPDDVFNSDEDDDEDSFDENMNGHFLKGQELTSSLFIKEQFAVNQQHADLNRALFVNLPSRNSDHQTEEELKKHFDYAAVETEMELHDEPVAKSDTRDLTETSRRIESKARKFLGPTSTS